MRRSSGPTEPDEGQHGQSEHGPHEGQDASRSCVRQKRCEAVGRIRRSRGVDVASTGGGMFRERLRLPCRLTSELSASFVQQQAVDSSSITKGALVAVPRCGRHFRLRVRRRTDLGEAPIVDRAALADAAPYDPRHLHRRTSSAGRPATASARRAAARIPRTASPRGRHARARVRAAEGAAAG